MKNSFILAILFSLLQLNCFAAASTWQDDLTKANAFMKTKDGSKAAPLLKDALTKAGSVAKLSRQELYALESSTAYMSALRFSKFREKTAGMTRDQIAAPYKEMVAKILIENKLLLGLYEKHCGKDDAVSVKMRTSVQNLERKAASM